MTTTAPPAPRAGSRSGTRPPRPPVRVQLEQVRTAIRRSNAAMTPGARAVTWTLGTFTALALWLVLFGLVLSGLVASHAQDGLYSRFRGELAAGVAPVGGAISEGSPVAVLSSPAASLDDVVAVEGSSGSDLRSGPGHLPGSPLPGQAGVSVLLGRATSFGAPFAHLTDLHAGDVLTVTTGQGTFSYTVQDVRRPGDPLPAALTTGQSRLVLVTAGGGGWRSGWAPSYAIYVDALLKGRSAPAPAQGSIASTRDNALARDTRGMYPLVLWLQLLLAAAIGGVWLRSRWGASRAWLIALPIGMAALWGASTNAWLLLPNLL